MPKRAHVWSFTTLQCRRCGVWFEWEIACARRCRFLFIPKRRLGLDPPLGRQAKDDEHEHDVLTRVDGPS